MVGARLLLGGCVPTCDGRRGATRGSRNREQSWAWAVTPTARCRTGDHTPQLACARGCPVTSCHVIVCAVGVSLHRCPSRACVRARPARPIAQRPSGHRLPHRPRVRSAVTYVRRMPDAVPSIGIARIGPAVRHPLEYAVPAGSDDVDERTSPRRSRWSLHNCIDRLVDMCTVVRPCRLCIDTL
eukprot:3559425-Prymnesium_polylepis.1